MFWKKVDHIMYDGFYRDQKPVHIFYEFEIKLNFNYIWNYTTKEIIFTINSCIQNWFNLWVDRKFVYEGENPFRLIDENKLRLINSHINNWYKDEWCPNNIKVRNIKITHLI